MRMLRVLTRLVALIVARRYAKTVGSRFLAEAYLCAP
jgi:hypothetical protein